MRLIRRARRDSSVDGWLARQGIPSIDKHRSLSRNDQIRAIAVLTELRAAVVSPLDSRNLTMWATSAAVLALLAAVSGPSLPAPCPQLLLVPVPFVVAFVVAATVVADRRLGPHRARLGPIEGRLAEFQGHLKAPEPETAGLVVASLGRIQIHLRPPRQSPDWQPEVDAASRCRST